MRIIPTESGGRHISGDTRDGKFSVVLSAAAHNQRCRIVDADGREVGECYAIFRGESANREPCVHHGDMIATIKGKTCGGCSTRVYACALHDKCVDESTAADLRACAGCGDFQKSITEVPLASFVNKFAGKTGYVVGRGKTTFDYERLADHDGPVFTINDSVVVERHLKHDNCFWFCIDSGHEQKLKGMRSLPVLHHGGWADKTLWGARRVCWWTQEPTGHGTKALLDLTPEQIAARGMLYRSVGTIQPLIHFAWMTGVRKLILVGCDGLPIEWDARLPNLSNRDQGVVYDRIREEADRVMAKLGIESEYVGTPEYKPDPNGGRVVAVSEPRRTGPDFTMTAMRRPEIVRRTVESFAANLRGIDLRQSTLRLNIDPMPKDGSEAEVINAVSRVFGRVVVNAPVQACFPAAVRWLWSRVTTERFFHLEDDWILNQHVPFDELMKMLDADPALSVVNLRAYGFTDERVCLSPGLWRADHAKRIADSLTDDRDPEEQIRPWQAANVRLKLKGARWPNEQRRVIEDIGREWMTRNGWAKNMGNRLTTWNPQ